MALSSYIRLLSQNSLRPSTRQIGICSFNARYLKKLKTSKVLPSHIYSRYNATITSGTGTGIKDPVDTSEAVLEAEATKGKDEQNDVEGTTGEIEKKYREGIFYFDNVYPVTPGKFSIVSQFMSYILGLTEKRVENTIVHHAFPSDLPVKFTQLIPRYKDGGAFAKYEISSSAPELTHDEVEALIYARLKDNDYRPLFNPFRRMRVFAVKGVPWIEDLKRASSKQVRVVFDGEDLSEESLYKVLRRYGSIIDIVPPSPAAKELPRSALVEFARLRDSCTARNCVNSLIVENTKIHITYVPAERAGWIKKSIIDHPRIFIPVFLALLATLAVLIFEPIRSWFIKKKVCNQPLFEKSEIYQWFIRVTKTTLSTLSRYLHISGSNQIAQFGDLWSARQESINTLQQWLEENVNTFMVVNGPRGSGKRELVSKIALKERSNVLTIDCESLAKARNETAFIKAASAQLGYYPVFPWMKNLTTFVDLIVQGLTGQKTGFSESTDIQFKSMLSTTVTALREIALENYKKADKEELSISEEDYLQLHSEAKPVVVISHFLNRIESSNTFIYSHLAEFASILVQANVAHVIFITNDVSFESTLSPALPNHMFKVLKIGDADPQSAKSFVLQQISEANKTAVADSGSSDKPVTEPKASDYPDIDHALHPLGGRMTDLQTFARRIMSGEKPMTAAQDMIEQSSSEILQMYLLKLTAQWTREQVWVLIKKLAALDPSNKLKKVKSDSWFSSQPVETSDYQGESTAALPELPFTDLLVDPNFKSLQQQEALMALQHCEMISLQQVGGRPVSVKAGKPLFQAAFKALIADKELTAMMETQLMEKLVAAENAKISKFEEELLSLAQLPRRWEVKQRIDYLSNKLSVSQTKILDYEINIKVHEKVLKEAKKDRKE